MAQNKKISLCMHDAFEYGVMSYNQKYIQMTTKRPQQIFSHFDLLVGDRSSDVLLLFFVLLNE